MANKLRFSLIDVFTTTRFLGNPLAIVYLPENFTLTQSKKQLIAKEFNQSETIFIHEQSGLVSPIVVDIFTADRELPFAGHPTVGSGWYLLSRAGQTSDSVTLRTKAGDIPVVRASPTSVRLQVPLDFRIHAPYSHPTVKSSQSQLNDSDFINGLSGAEPVVSIVKGMTFILLQLSSEKALADLRPPAERLSAPDLGEWGSGGFVALYAFFEREDGVMRTRMFSGSLEDPATGSAASTLAGWLATKKGKGTWKIEIVQGVEMGRRSEISVLVEVNEEATVKRVELEGGAVEVMEGWLEL